MASVINFYGSILYKSRSFYDFFAALLYLKQQGVKIDLSHYNSSLSPVSPEEIAVKVFEYSTRKQKEILLKNNGTARTCLEIDFSPTDLPHEVRSPEEDKREGEECLFGSIFLYDSIIKLFTLTALKQIYIPPPLFFSQRNSRKDTQRRN